MDIIKKITSWNKLLWIVTVIIWSIVCVQWVASNIDPETGQKRWHTNLISPLEIKSQSSEKK